MERVAILGAGNGGTAMAAHLTLQGHSVALYDKFPAVIADIASRGGVQLSGVGGSGFAKLDLVTADLAAAVVGAHLLMVVLPAFAHRGLAQELAQCLAGGQVVVLNPGRTGGALEVKEVLAQAGCNSKVVVAEAETFLYASRRTGPLAAHIYGIKTEVGVAALPNGETKKVVTLLQRYFPQFVERDNVLHTSFANIGAIFHPGPTVLNAARIESTRGDFDYYHQGITPSVGRVLEQIDCERLRVAAAYGLAVPSTREWLGKVYGAQGVDLATAVGSNQTYAGIKAPPSLEVRYLTEDVPMSLVPLQALGKLAGVPTPAMDSIIQLASLMLGRDLVQEGRGLEALGLEGMNVEEVKAFVSS